MQPNTGSDSPSQESQLTGQVSEIRSPSKTKSQPSTLTAVTQPPKAAIAVSSSAHSVSLSSEDVNAIPAKPDKPLHP